MSFCARRCAHTHTHTHTHTHAHTHTHIHSRSLTLPHTHSKTQTHNTHTHRHTQTHRHTDTHKHTHTRTHTHTHTHTHTVILLLHFPLRSLFYANAIADCIGNRVNFSVFVINNCWHETNLHFPSCIRHETVLQNNYPRSTKSIMTICFLAVGVMLH